MPHARHQGNYEMLLLIILGIATELLDNACSLFIYAFVIDRKQVVRVVIKHFAILGIFTTNSTGLFTRL